MHAVFKQLVCRAQKRTLNYLVIWNAKFCVVCRCFMFMAQVCRTCVCMCVCATLAFAFGERGERGERAGETPAHSQHTKHSAWLFIICLDVYFWWRRTGQHINTKLRRIPTAVACSCQIIHMNFVVHACFVIYCFVCLFILFSFCVCSDKAQRNV